MGWGVVPNLGTRVALLDILYVRPGAALKDMG